MLYFSIFILLSVLIYHYDYRNNEKGRNTWYFLVLFIFILVAGLRYRLGVDSIRYESGYAYMPNLSELRTFDFSSTRYAPGYIILTSIAKSISSDFVAMQMLHSIFVNGVIFWFIKKYTDKTFFATTIYFIMLYFNFMCEVMRESCAVAAFLLAFPHFVSQRWIKYYIFVLLSVSFHLSAFICFLLPILYLPIFRFIFTIGKKTIFVLIGAYIVGAVVNVALFDYIKLIEIESIQESAANYEDNVLAGQVLNIRGIIALTVKYVIFPVIGIFFIKRRLKYTPKASEAEVLPKLEFMVSLCLISAALSVPIALFYRYNNYFFPFAIIAMSNFAFHSVVLGKKAKRLNYAKWCLLFSPILLIQLYGFHSTVAEYSNLNRNMAYYPYSSVFTKEKNPDREALFIYYNAD